MQLTSTRKKANAITSNILNRIAVRGQRKVADALGINESQISRWKDSFIPKMAMLLAVLDRERRMPGINHIPLVQSCTWKP